MAGGTAEVLQSLTIKWSSTLYTDFTLYILWLPLSNKTFQTWTCSPAQVLIRSLLLSSSTQRKRFRMIVVRDTLKTFCFPSYWLVLSVPVRRCHPTSLEQSQSYASAQKRSNSVPQKLWFAGYQCNGCIYRLFANVVRDSLADGLGSCWTSITSLTIWFLPHKEHQPTPLHSLRHILATAKEKKMVFTAFLDLFAAYDSVPREELWRHLQKSKTPHNLMMMAYYIGPDSKLPTTKLKRNWKLINNREAREAGWKR